MYFGQNTLRKQKRRKNHLIYGFSTTIYQRSSHNAPELKAFTGPQKARHS